MARKRKTYYNEEKKRYNAVQKLEKKNLDNLIRKLNTIQIRLSYYEYIKFYFILLMNIMRKANFPSKGYLKDKHL